MELEQLRQQLQSQIDSLRQSVGLIYDKMTMMDVAANKARENYEKMVPQLNSVLAQMQQQIKALETKSEEGASKDVVEAVHTNGVAKKSKKKARTEENAETTQSPAPVAN